MGLNTPSYIRLVNRHHRVVNPWLISRPRPFSILSVTMGAKRPDASEGGAGDARTSARHAQSRHAKRIRPNSSNPHLAQSAAAAVNPIKAKIRDVTRLLERSNNLPAGVRIEKERALAGYKQDLEQAEAEKRKQQLISKYHMVRFFGPSLHYEGIIQSIFHSEVCVLICCCRRASKSHAKPQKAQSTHCQGRPWQHGIPKSPKRYP